VARTPAPPVPPVAPPEYPDPPPALRTSICRLATASGTVNEPRPTTNSIVTGAAANAGGLTATDQTTPSTTRAAHSPSARLAPIPGAHRLRTEPARPRRPARNPAISPPVDLQSGHRLSDSGRPMQDLCSADPVAHSQPRTSSLRAPRSGSSRSPRHGASRRGPLLTAQRTRGPASCSSYNLEAARMPPHRPSTDHQRQPRTVFATPPTAHDRTPALPGLEGHASKLVTSTWPALTADPTAPATTRRSVAARPIRTGTH